MIRRSSSSWPSLFACLSYIHTLVVMVSIDIISPSIFKWLEKLCCSAVHRPLNTREPKNSWRRSAMVQFISFLEIPRPSQQPCRQVLQLAGRHTRAKRERITTKRLCTRETSFLWFCVRCDGMPQAFSIFIFQHHRKKKFHFHKHTPPPTRTHVRPFIIACSICKAKHIMIIWANMRLFSSTYIATCLVVLYRLNGSWCYLERVKRSSLAFLTA